MAPPPFATLDVTDRICWREMRCSGCARLLQKIEEQTLPLGEHLRIKYLHRKVIRYLVGT